jgi:hypothetical protein
MPAEMLREAAMPPPYPAYETGAAKGRTAKSFGVSDMMAILAGAAVALALVPAFTWKKGLELSIFSHQGAYSPGRTDLLGGPGILPYSGVEFFTIGLVAAIGIGLAALFLAVRVGRGPMYTLAGAILLFPLAYLFFQAVLPLRQAGISAQPALGLRGLFFGNAANAGLGPPIWLIAGAGALLILAGFLAPPRGWGRLFTFLLFMGLAVGTAFFCAACYNWNLFLSDSSLASVAAGSGAALFPAAGHIFPH